MPTGLSALSKCTLINCTRSAWMFDWIICAPLSHICVCVSRINIPNNRGVCSLSVDSISAASFQSKLHLLGFRTNTWLGWLCFGKCRVCVSRLLSDVSDPAASTAQSVPLSGSPVLMGEHSLGSLNKHAQRRLRSSRPLDGVLDVCLDPEVHFQRVKRSDAAATTAEVAHTPKIRSLKSLNYRCWHCMRIV